MPITDHIMPICRPMLITGHSRAGTAYMSALARYYGMDMRHEALGKSGVSSWMMAPPAWRVPFHRGWANRGRLWYRFDRVIEVVREPLAHIASVAFAENHGSKDRRTGLYWRAQWTPIDMNANTVRQAVQSIVGWHEMIRVWLTGAVIMHMERARFDMAKMLGRDPVDGPGIVNARKHRPVTWKDVRECCDRPTWDALMEYCHDVGYETTARLSDVAASERKPADGCDNRRREPG